MTTALPAGGRADLKAFAEHAADKRRMKILYIARRRVRHGLKRKLHGYLHPFEGQEGFFVASLCAKFQVTIKHLDYLLRAGADLKGRYDWVLINHKSSLSSSSLTHEEYSQIANLAALRNCNVGLLSSNAEAGNLPSDADLDFFDVVFKRECLRDRDRYGISESNKAKLCTTMAACPLISPSRFEIRKKDIGHSLNFADPERNFENDVFFSGSSTNPMRETVIQRLLSEDLRFVGGLQYRRRDQQPDPGLASPRLSRSEYVRNVRTSRINLALEGYGELTYRHLEIWYLSSFMISSLPIGELQLPVDAKENEHYVAFHSADDLVDKIHYYLDRPEERERIATAGKKLFSRCYDFHQHGDYIEACLNNRASSFGAA